jgi:hypothetical protein
MPMTDADLIDTLRDAAEGLWNAATWAPNETTQVELRRLAADCIDAATWIARRDQTAPIHP